MNERAETTRGGALAAGTKTLTARNAGETLVIPRLRIRLPVLPLHFDNKLGYTLVWAPYIAAYQLVNRYPLREPVELTMTAVDRAIPFLPELLPLYVGYLGYFFWTVARLKNDREVSRVFYATHLQLVVSLVVFVLYPVRMPRELFYVEASYGWADTFWRWFDAPNNCLPSLHASNVMLLMHLNAERPGRIPALILGAAIIASTLFVKQHYAVDLLAGAGVYLLARAFLQRLTLRSHDA
jgi:membrane-associated phospholipid phosphatase